MRNSYVSLADSVEVFELNKKNTEIETYRGIDKVKAITLQSGDKEWFEYSFFYAVGIRLIESNESKEKEGENVAPLVEITSIFNAVYRSAEKIENNVIEEFSKDNVGYHVWPYWREFVQSASTRLNIPPLETPLYFCSPE